MQVQRTFKKRAGVWGIVKGDKGAASQLSPLSPLTKETKHGIQRDVSLTLNMTKGFSTESLPKDCVLGHSSKLIQVSSLNHCIP